MVEDEKIVLENELFTLIMATIENSYQYNSKNELVMLKSREEIIADIMSNIEEYCERKAIDKKMAMEIAKVAIARDNELKYKPDERKLAVDLLDIEEK